MVFRAITQFTFPHTFFDTIPIGNYTNASSVPRDECKISCFWKNNDDLLSKPSSVLQYQHSVLCYYQTSIIQFHFIHTLKTIRQPFSHHTFCTPLTRHRHCSVGSAPAVPIKTPPAVQILSTDSTTAQPQHPQIFSKPPLIYNQFCRKTTHSDGYK